PPLFDPAGLALQLLCSLERGRWNLDLHPTKLDPFEQPFGPASTALPGAATSDGRWGFRPLSNRLASAELDFQAISLPMEIPKRVLKRSTLSCTSIDLGLESIVLLKQKQGAVAQEVETRA